MRKIGNNFSNDQLQSDSAVELGVSLLGSPPIDNGELGLRDKFMQN